MAGGPVRAEGEHVPSVTCSLTPRMRTAGVGRDHAHHPLPGGCGAGLQPAGQVGLVVGMRSDAQLAYELTNRQRPAQPVALVELAPVAGSGAVLSSSLSG